MEMRLMRVGLCVALLAAVLVGCQGLGGAATPSPTARQVTLVGVEGTVELVTVRGKTMLAQAGQTLAVGDQIRTYADGRATLELDDGTVTVIAENTVFEIKTLAGDSASPITRFFINVGAVFSFHKDELPPGAAYEVQTPSGVAAIRGSSVGVIHGLLESATAPGSKRARPVTQIGGVSRVTCLEGNCSATTSDQSVSLTDAEAVNIETVGKLGSVEPMTSEDFEGWIEAFETARAAGLLSGIDQDEFIPPTPTPQATVVPDLTGLTLDQAEMTLTALGLAMEVVESKPCINVEAGQVSTQDPLPGVQFQAGTVVSVVECTGPPGTGDVQVTLTWGATADLDLIVTDPEGNEVAYYNTTSPTGGSLDVDANAYCNAPLTTSPVENIFWPAGTAPNGTYSVVVLYSLQCNAEGTVSYTVTVTVDGNTETFTGSISPDNFVSVTEFTR